MTHSFKILRELLSRLTKKEISFLKKKITYTPVPEDLKKNKSKKLVELLISRPEISEVDTIKEIYSSINRIAFSKLVERTIEKLDEIFISFDSDSSLFDSERNYQFFFLKRKLLILQMRWLRGVTNELALQIEKIIHQSKKYELYEILIDALHIKQRYNVNNGKRGVEQIETEIVKYENVRRKVQNARGIWTKLGARISQSVSFWEYSEELAKALDILKADYEETKSVTVYYIYLFVQLDFNQNIGKFIEAKLILNELYNLIIDNPSLYTKIRHGEILINLSNNEILLEDFGKAIKNIEKAKVFFEDKTEVLDTAKEIEFYARFYNDQIDNAEKVIEEIYISSRKGNRPFLYGKRTYLFACIKTIKGEIEKSNELLQEVREIEKIKGGWNIAKRVLTIINCIESKDYEKADLKVINLEKFIKRNSALHHVRKRDILILRILLKLINEGFEFKKVYKKRKRYFDLLESKDPEYCWKIKSPELIVFHEWFRKKMDAEK